MRWLSDLFQISVEVAEIAQSGRNGVRDVARRKSDMYGLHSGPASGREARATPVGDTPTRTFLTVRQLTDTKEPIR